MKKRQIFAIGDVHGCAHELDLLVKKLPLNKDSLIIFVGDFIDRGPDSKEVIDLILDLKKDYEVIALKGNHEKMLLDFLANKDSQEAAAFIFNGGGATLASYSNEKGEYSLPNEHLAFFQSLQSFYETEDYFFVHAGVPDINLEDISLEKHEKTMLWVREPFTGSTFDWGKTIVHGHTPTEDVDASAKRINIDTSCVYGGKLSAIQLPERIVFEVGKQAPLEHKYLRDNRGARRSVRYVGNIPINIYVDGKVFYFKTVNFSELGMLMVDTNYTDEELLKAGQKLTGDIVLKTGELAKFKAEILRCDHKATGIFYAVHFINPPCGVDLA